MNNSQAESQDHLGQLIEGAAMAPDRPRSEGRLGNLARLHIASETLRALPSDFVKRHHVLGVVLHEHGAKIMPQLMHCSKMKK